MKQSKFLCSARNQSAVLIIEESCITPPAGIDSS